MRQALPSKRTNRLPQHVKRDFDDRLARWRLPIDRVALDRNRASVVVDIVASRCGRSCRPRSVSAPLAASCSLRQYWI